MKRLAVSRSRTPFPVLLAVTGVLVLVALVAASTAVAGGGNSAAAKLCQKGGWQTFEQSNGAPFASQSDCVSYAAGGGTLFLPTLTITQTAVCVQSSATGNFVYEWSEQGTGFTPNSSLTITTDGDSLTLPTPFDSTGAKTVHFIPDSAGETLSVTWTDGNGVHASATLGPTEACAP